LLHEWEYVGVIVLISLPGLGPFMMAGVLANDSKAPETARVTEGRTLDSVETSIQALTN